jgi:hypothetical protein
MSRSQFSWPRTVAVAVWLVVKLAVFLLLGRTDAARFVYAGF